MSSIPVGFTISLRSWPAADKVNNNLALDSVVARINAERANRGGFRELTKERLQLEIEEEAAEEDDESEEEGEDAPVDRAKEIQATKVTLIQNIDMILDSARSAQSFATLALSKDMPQVVDSARSSNTLLGGEREPNHFWEHIQKTVPMKTLGMDKMQGSLVTYARKEENKSVARGWKIQNLSKTVDSILAAATRLETEMELETKYWDQVLSIDDGGWAMCHMQYEKHTLGVRFGFMEGAQRNLSMAALRRGPDGDILLDAGLDSEPKAIRVRIQGHHSFASSSVPKLYEDGSPVQFRIQQARNTVFATELWQEITREARNLLDFGVAFEGDTVVCPFTPGKTLILELIPLKDSGFVLPHPDNKMADGISVGLQLLLSLAHRQNHHRRTRQPVPLRASKPDTQPYSLIRPLLTRLNHQKSVESMHKLITSTITTLKSTGIEASYSQLARAAPVHPNAAPTERVILSLMDRLEMQTKLQIIPGIGLDIISRTDMFPIASTIHKITLSPPDSPLRDLCPPPEFDIDNWDHVEDYILFANSCSLATYILNLQKLSPFPSQSSHSQPSVPPSFSEEEWQPSVNPNAILKHVKDTGVEKHLTLEFEKAPAEEVLCRARWEMVGDEDIFEPGSGNKRGSENGSYEWRSVGANMDDSDEVQVVVRSLAEVAGI
ncbi:subunit 17 of mediator complex-domain-containing protein [Calycina marina]|uniref:Mediator of RNA polymerase II transcription subunit 17 n=1 Tax=Calycina marina TaxID=1763456 RepID=A0A9P8CDN6_9HELO|nr:subunit 17 of mediator complex-domain-containing protein [Calycina marina]